MSGSKFWIVVALTTFPLLGSLSQWNCCYELFHSCVLLWRTVSSLAVRRLDGFDIVCVVVHVHMMICLHCCVHVLCIHELAFSQSGQKTLAKFLIGELIGASLLSWDLFVVTNPNFAATY